VNARLQSKGLTRYKEVYGQKYFDGDRDLSPTRITETLQLLGDIKGKSILDLGCGTGEASALLRKAGAEVTCVDISKISTTICHNSEFESLQSATHTLPFSNEAFDGVLFMDVIEHVPKPLVISTLKEIKRVTKMNGKIAIHTMPTLFLEKLSELYGLVNKQHWRRWGEQGGHINVYTSWRLKKEVTLAGLGVLHFKVGNFPANSPFARIATPLSKRFSSVFGNDIWICCIP
jgi:2-polyprenyl-3-methyl-5-hydroxy-6-metoxy-1,4-benzoquinol methylase